MIDLAKSVLNPNRNQVVFRKEAAVDPVTTGKPFGFDSKISRVCQGKSSYG